MMTIPSDISHYCTTMDLDQLQLHKVPVEKPVAQDATERSQKELGVVNSFSIPPSNLAMFVQYEPPAV